MKNYKQLSLEQRYKMDALLKAGLKQKDIATRIGVHPSTVSREIKRNVAQRGNHAFHSIPFHTFGRDEYILMTREQRCCA